MSSRDWESLGANIRDIVEQAVNSNDFEKLSQSISSAVNTAINSVSDSISEGVNSAGRAMNNSVKNTREVFGNYRSFGPGKINYNSRQARPAIQPGGSTTLPAYKRIAKENTVLFRRMTKQQVGGILQMVFGYSMLAIMGGTTLALGLVWGLADIATTAAMSSTIFCGLGTVGFGIMAAIGNKRYAMSKRFHSYIKALQGKEYANLDQIAMATRKSVAYVRKDLEKMIKKNWFYQGHFDQTKSCLMVTDKMYREYEDNRLKSEQVLVEQKKQEEIQAKEQTKENAVSEILRTGNIYLSRIRECNQAIPGEEISSKITKIEIIVQRIFERVEKHPENESDIQKMMEYYLPTTVKLLEAYAELDKQPVQGENITNSKHEIESSLDTLNRAFEKLLDELFQDTAWDVSTDISVLKTVLAQDGLTEQDFIS